MFILIFLLSFLTAQANVMDLNEFMPTRMEDATVTQTGKIDLQASGNYDDSSESTLIRPNLRYGLMKRVHLEFSQDIINGPKDSEKGSGRTAAGFQWNFNDQDDWVPSMAFEPKFLFPTGKDVDGIDPSLRLILTSTLVGTSAEPLGQFHFNYQWDHNSDKDKDERKSGYEIVFGYSHRISPHSSLMADLFHDKDVFTSDTVNEIELGWMHEFAREFYIAIGAGLQLNDGFFTSTLGIQKTF